MRRNVSEFESAEGKGLGSGKRSNLLSPYNEIEQDGYALIPEKNAMRDKNLILVVDDSPTVLHGTCRILQKDGYETIEASSGMDGLRLTIEHKPDLVLLDVVLPDIYGYEVCRRIKEEADLKGTFVILISSLDTHEDHQAQGLEIGADGYIARPVSNRNLLAHIKSLLRLKAAEDNLRQSQLKFRTVADFTYDWEYWIAPDGCILYMSPSADGGNHAAAGRSVG